MARKQRMTVMRCPRSGATTGEASPILMGTWSVAIYARTVCATGARIQRQNGGKSGFFLADERQELVTGLLVMAESPEHRAGNGLAALLFHAAHLHAQVTSFDDHAHTLRNNFL